MTSPDVTRIGALGAGVALLFAATAAHAGDGVVEISQVCAVQTGCFPGDAPGFPVTIDGSAGRSYLLTSDLVVPDTASACRSSSRRRRRGLAPRGEGLATQGALKYELNFMSQMPIVSETSEVQANGHTTRRLETRRKLLEAGTELFAEGGVRAATSTAIARRAGVATGTFYLHFPDKHALFEELVDAALEEMRPQSDAERTGRPGDASMRRDLERMLAVAERRRNLIRAVFDRGESSGLAERVQDRIAGTLEERYTRVFPERGIPLHPGAAAQARAALMVRVIAWWAEDPARATRDEIVEILMELAPGRVPEEAR